MRNFLSKVLEHKWISLSSLLSLGLVVGGWIWVVISLRGITQPLIIHFNDYVGINRIGGLKDVSSLAIFGVIAVILNFLMALEFEDRDWFWGKLLALVSVLVAGLIFISFVVIINVN